MALSEMLKTNAGLQFLTLENNNIAAEGTAAIARALAVNTTLEHLNLCTPPFNTKGATTSRLKARTSSCTSWAATSLSANC